MDDEAGARSAAWIPERRVIAVVMAAALLLSVLAGVLVLVPHTAAAGVDLGTSAAVSRPLRIGVSGQKAVTTNPNAITLSLEFVIVYNIYSTLITYDGSYHITGDLAYQWEVASDNVSWTFHLVHNAYFTDPGNPSDRSHPVTADDVVFSYNLVMTHSASILNSFTTEIASVTKLDDYTVRLVTKEPLAAITSTLTGVTIFPQYAWSGIRNPVTQEPTNPIGSGAMYYDSNSVLSSGPIILRRNPNYYGDAQYCRFSRPDDVRFIFYTTPGLMAGSFTSGADGLDAIFNIPAPVFLSGLTAGPGENIFKFAVSGGFVGEVALNQMTPALRSAFTQYRTGSNNPDLRNATVRKAIAMSIDKAAIVRYAYQGLATVADTLVPASNPWHYTIPASERFPFDPAGARKLLNDAGWNFTSTGAPATPTTTPLYKSGGADPLQFRLYTPDSHSEFAVALANITVWLGQAGIQTTDSKGSTTPGYEVKGLNQMNSIWKAADYDIWLWDWIFSPVSDPSLDVLEVETSMAIPTTSDNWYVNSTFDALYNQSLTTVDPAARRQITNTMQKMVYDYASYVLPYYAQDLYAVTNSTNYGYGWENWGDWAQSPGLVPDSSYPSLWFHVYPHDNPPPTISAFPSVQYVSGNPVDINVIAADPNDAALNYTWDFGDGSPLQNTTTNTVPHTYAQPGTYTVNVRVKDSEWPACASTTATITAPTGNLPPVATLNYQFSGGLSHGWVNQSVAFSVTVRDPEGDPLFITWNFGDGATATNSTTNTATDHTLARAHTYSHSGNFTVVVTVTDNQTGPGHVQIKTATIPIWKQSTGGGGGGGTTAQANPWINYGVPLAIVLAVVVAIVVVALRRRRTIKEDEKREGPQPPLPPPP